MLRLGLSLPLDGFDLKASIELAEFVEALGYTDVWTSEISGADAFSLLAAIAARTDRLRLGAGIVPVFTRAPALIAMSAATVQGISGGRFCLGLGSSTETVVESWMGFELRHPLARVRETVEAVRMALSGSKVSLEGDTVRMRDFRLTLSEDAFAPIMVGALGPRMLQLAAEIADGVVLSHVGLSVLPDLVNRFHASVEASGRDRADVDVILRLGVAIDEDPELLCPILRRELAGYGRTRFYNASFARQGYENEARAIANAWLRGDRRAAAAAVSNRMIQDMFVVGAPSVCRDRLSAYRDAGVKTPVIIPISIAAEPELRNHHRRQVLESLL